MSLPVVRLDGDTFAQGLAQGEALAGRIAHNVALYFDRFARETLLPRDAVLEIAGQYAQRIAQQDPEYDAGMRGIARGSGRELLEIVALNVRYEILYYQFGKLAIARQAAPSDGCTAFAALPEATAEGRLLMGQNWDWIPDVQGAVLETTDPDGFRTLAYTESGIFGAKIGLNDAALGLAINGMTTVEDDWSRLTRPFHVRCYRILRSRRLEDAIAVVADETRACSANFLIAQAPDRVADIEAAPEAVRVLGCQDGCLTHANHFIDPTALGVVEPPNERRIYSRRREARLRELLLLARPLRVEAIQEALRDTRDDPFGLCRHRNLDEPSELHYVTVTSAVMDLERRRLWLTDGPPDQGPYQQVSL